MSNLKLLLLLTAAFLAGCTALPNKISEPVGERRLEYVLSQHGTSAVVFENGLGASLDSWAKVFPEIAKDTTAFAYNRPGYGNSEPPSSPRDGEHIVDELRSSLRGKGLKPPYVLVGHSLGGLYMQLFARRYPEEVQGLILVDSTHPNQFKGKGAPENWPIWVRVAFGIYARGVFQEEFNSIDSTGEAVLSLPAISGKPVIVLSATKYKDDQSENDVDAHEKRADIARLYPGSKQVWVDCGHGIPLDKPEAVIAAIREVLPSKRPIEGQ